MNWRKPIPWSMVLLRVALGPALLLAAWLLPAPQFLLGAMIAAGFVSDVYDGILARRWGIATDALRVADSAADTVFYLGVLAAIVVRHWPVLRQRIWLLAVLLALEVLRMLFDWIKFRRMASYHSYAARLWGLLLVSAAIAVLCFDSAHWLVTAALAWGIFCDTEGLAMSAVLPRWTHDVKTMARALKLRGEMLRETACPTAAP